jgi:hypothetical protein
LARHWLDDEWNLCDRFWKNKLGIYPLINRPLAD